MSEWSDQAASWPQPEFVPPELGVQVGLPDVMNGWCPFCGFPLSLRRTTTEDSPDHYSRYTDRVCQREAEHRPGTVAIPLD